MTCSWTVPTQEVALGSPTSLEAQSEAVAEVRVSLMP